MKKIKYVIVGLSIILFMGFTTNSTNTAMRYQMMYIESQSQLIMLDTYTAQVYKYDFDFNTWREITFGNHIKSH